ncbi:MAG: hypothetical protein GC192_01095 [Bacteroidetes bacterium]|nr:hypothetical protein [Bacteroidota bacterium]
MNPWIFLFFIGSLTACMNQSNKKSTHSTSNIANIKNAAEGLVFFSNNGGKTWVGNSDGIPKGAGLTDISLTESKTGISTKKHGIYIFEENAKYWKPVRDANFIGFDANALLLSEDRIYVGTDGGGVFVKTSEGSAWSQTNLGLENLVIRKIVEYQGKVFAGTNGGIYYLSKTDQAWVKDFSLPNLQVNGIAFDEGHIYIGTNQGAFKRAHNRHDWQLIFPTRSFHNISVVNGVVYGMIYNELFISENGGENWLSGQVGMPDGLYTFQVVGAGTSVIAGQWDGLYAETPLQTWVKYGADLPLGIPITELKGDGARLVAATSGWFVSK